MDEHLINQLKSLPKEERIKLVKLMMDINDEEKKKHSITELAGLGKELWNKVDVQGYIDKERSDGD